MGEYGALTGPRTGGSMGRFSLWVNALVVVGEVYIELFLSLVATGRGYLQSEKQKQRRG